MERCAHFKAWVCEGWRRGRSVGVCEQGLSLPVTALGRGKCRGHLLFGDLVEGSA
jgi:hypothetical protein